MTGTLPPDDFAVRLNDAGKIEDFLSTELLEPSPEEFVRQRYIRILHLEYGYPKAVLRREVPIYSGSTEAIDNSGKPIRADIVVYHNERAARERDQGRISLVVECKAPNKTTGYNQLVSYVFNTSAEGGVWFNGSGEDDEVRYYRRHTRPENAFVEWIGIPRYNEDWEALGRRKKSELLKPKDIRGLLRRCHNKLHGRGPGSDEEDLTMDMVRIILAKAQDEERTGDMPDFYCSTEEYETPEGQRAVASRINALFGEVKRLNSSVFSEHETITVAPRAVCDVVVELQSYQLISDLDDAHDWDIMGAAYEQYTSASLRRERGQFFTNRLVANFLVAALDPTYDQKVLDPAGGSGGFLTAALRYVRSKVLAGSAGRTAKTRQLERFKNHLFMVEDSRRLVKVAKTSMILNGDGHAGMTAGDSLGPFSAFDETIVAQCGRGVPNIILTNPPFAGVGEGKITDAETLSRYACGRRWEVTGGSFTPTDELLTGGVPPELLFFERCIDWLAPGGLLGIVLPKSFLDTATYRSGRELLFRECELLAVVNCHKDTFQPHTGVRTCLLLLRKFGKTETPPTDYSIFMAVSRKIGQDSEGVPIYRRDADGKPSEILDHDLDEILAAFRDLRNGALTPSQYCFSTKRSELDEQLRINPQRFLPHLNETLESLTRLGDVDGWSLIPLSQIAADIRVFKGPRLASAQLVVDSGEEVGTERYYTPGAVLQDKADSAKWIRVSAASPKQRKTIDVNRVSEGFIVITRSGSIGRVAYIGPHLDGAVLSDDLIRVVIPDPSLRSFVYQYLQTVFAQNQMLMNEYGAVQQHLEPEHIANLLVPLPDDWTVFERILSDASRLQVLRAEVQQLTRNTLDAMTETIQGAMPSAPG